MENTTEDKYRVAILDVSTCCGGNVIEVKEFDDRESALLYSLEYNKHPPAAATPGYTRMAKYLGIKVIS